MKLGVKKIQDILIKGSYITTEDIELASKKKISQEKILDYFLSEGILSRDLIGQAIAEFYNVPYADLNSKTPSREQIKKISQSIASKYRVVLFDFDNKNKKIVIATDEPQSKSITGQIKKIFPKTKIEIRYSLTEDIDNILRGYQKKLETRFAKIIKKQNKIAPEIINEIVRDALNVNTSDIHFEPKEASVLIRFRIDGVLQEVASIEKNYYQNILNRIKVQAHLRIDEHASTQDGAIRFREDNIDVDMRVSVVPTLNGEKIVIRLLAKHVEGLNLENLGLLTDDQETIEKAYKKPFGMIIVSGPTGSGKTTTLYSILKKVDHPDVNITTIEDPVEYKLEGANQIQVNNATNITFAKGLRSIVRQDPDIILVGEIRDQETAEIAVNAALTGHLLFSTFHANDAASTIPRLLDMGAEPFLLSSTLNVVVAQRLARKICENCRVSKKITAKDLANLPKNLKNTFAKEKNIYYGKGCPACNGTGYRGRVGLFEIIEIGPEIKKAILSKKSSQEIWEIAKKIGTRSMYEDGLQKVKQGLTTLEELQRVAEIK